MKTKRLFQAFAATAVVWAGTASDAATFSTSTLAPTVNGADIAQLGSTDADWGTSVLWGDRPARGQTFTTGSDELNLLAYTVQSNMAQADDGAYTLRVSTVSGSDLTVVATESITTDVNVSANDYITFTFDTPILLAANTIYGIDLGRSGSGWSSYRNTDDNSYSGGTAYSSGGSGVGGATLSTHSTDRVFHLDIAAVPEPTSLALLAMGGLMIARRRKG